MSNIFNTTFEISLRVLLILESTPREWISSDRIAATDFITVYGKDFGITSENLHGENNYRYSEFTLRRGLVKEALKSLVFRDLVHVQNTSDGLAYTLAKDGGEYSAKLEGEYARIYREFTLAVNQFTANKTERDLLSLINRYSLSAMRRSN